MPRVCEQSSVGAVVVAVEVTPVMSTTPSNSELDGFGLSAAQVDEVRMAVVEACINFAAPPWDAGQEALVVLEPLGADPAPDGMLITIRTVGADLPKGAFALGAEEDPAAARKRRHGLKILEGLMDSVEVRSDSEGVAVVMRKMR